MKVQITLMGSLRDKLPREAKGKTTLTLADSATVADVLEQLALSATTAAAIGGTQVERAHLLQDGDELQLFRMLGGG